MTAQPATEKMLGFSSASVRDDFNWKN